MSTRQHSCKSSSLAFPRIGFIQANIYPGSRCACALANCLNTDDSHTHAHKHTPTHTHRVALEGSVTDQRAWLHLDLSLWLELNVETICGSDVRLREIWVQILFKIISNNLSSLEPCPPAIQGRLEQTQTRFQPRWSCLWSGLLSSKERVLCYAKGTY